MFFITIFICIFVLTKKLKLNIMSYYDDIDEIGEAQDTQCVHCGTYTEDTYCSIQCKTYDTE